jgi:hypothetical protein
MEIRFTQSARRHRVGRASARRVIEAVTPVRAVTERGDLAWWYVGCDERGRELEIVAVELNDPDPSLLVIHVMPTHLRR